jgi:hypothetical protein
MIGARGVALVACVVIAPNTCSRRRPRPKPKPTRTRGTSCSRPAAAKFRIIYEVTATTPGATHYFNPIRKGSVASNERVFDRATGKPLVFDEVGVDVARAGGVRSNDTSQKYIRVKLARPVPPDGGEARVLIDKTYEDAASYFVRGDTIVFTRPLGIKRNSVILPNGYELVSSSFPSQVLQSPTDASASASGTTRRPKRQ